MKENAIRLFGVLRCNNEEWAVRTGAKELPLILSRPSYGSPLNAVKTVLVISGGGGHGKTTKDDVVTPFFYRVRMS